MCDIQEFAGQVDELAKRQYKIVAEQISIQKDLLALFQGSHPDLLEEMTRISVGMSTICLTALDTSQLLATAVERTEENLYKWGILEP